MMDNKNKTETNIKPEDYLASNIINSGVHMGFDNDGNVVMKNRAYRRRKISLFPKSSQLRKKKPRKNKKKSR